MINIHINGEPFTLPVKSNVADALMLFLTEAEQKMSYAIALNHDFVNKNQYSEKILKAGDAIDVLFPIHGG